MIAKKFRLPLKNYFGVNGKKAVKTAKSGHLAVKIYPPEAAFSRFGVVVSKKVDKRATRRNFIKRLVLDFFKAKQNQFPVKDYVFNVLSLPKEYKKPEIVVELEKILKLF